MNNRGSQRTPITSKTIRKLISIGIVVVLALVFSLTTSNFLTVRNIFLLLKDAAYVGLIAIGLSFVMVGGGIDLSAGGIVCVVAIVCSRLAMTGMPGIIVLVLTVLTGAVCGAINALLVTKAHLTEFVATLASGFVYSGLGLLLAFRDTGKLSGTLISKSITNKSVLALGGHVGGLYFITIFWVVLTVLIYFVQTKTRFGLHTYAMGSNTKSAKMSGVNGTLIKGLGFIICGAFAGLASNLVVSNIGATTASLGSGYEFQAIAACVVGGVVLGGGKGDAFSAMIGSLFLVLVMNGLMKYGLPVAWQTVLQGAIIVAATTFDAKFGSIMGRHPIKSRMNKPLSIRKAGGVQ